MNNLALSIVLNHENNKAIVELNKIQLKKEFIKNNIDKVTSHYKEISWLVQMPHSNIDEYLEFNKTFDSINQNNYDENKYKNNYYQYIQPLLDKHNKLIKNLFTDEYNKNYNLGILTGFLLGNEFHSKLCEIYENTDTYDNFDLKSSEDKLNMLLNCAPDLIFEYGYGFHQDME